MDAKTEVLVKWYIGYLSQWINHHSHLPEYYSTHMVEEPNVIIQSIRNTMEQNLDIGIKLGEIKKEDVDELLSNLLDVKKFVEAVFDGLKKEFPLQEKE